MKKQVFWEVPEGYRLHLDLRLAEDRKSFIIMLVLQVLAVAVTVLFGRLRCPYGSAFEMEIGRVLFGLAAMSVGIFIYIIAHEWVHGVAIRLITGQKADFGIDWKKGMAYASSPAYFGRLPYILIAMAPVVFWGVILYLLLKDIPDTWFWYLYVIQMMNISGAAGDFYVTWLTLKAPKGTIVTDSGTSMRFYVPETAEERF